ncbi:MAG: MFS transporter [Chloroflexi bacterium]|nr:MFS transporter [Chloroflexota bacterium]
MVSLINSLKKPKFYYGWVIFGSAFAIDFVAIMGYNPMLSLFIKPLAEEFGWSRAQISAVAGVGVVVGGLVAVPLGPFLDKKGTRLTLTLGTFLLGTLIASLYWLESLWQFYIFYGAARAISIGVLEVGIQVAVANWFIKKRGRAIGAALLGQRLGVAFFSFLAGYIIIATGWRAAWLVLGIFVLVLGVAPCAIYMRRRPEDMGLRPDGEAPTGTSNPGYPKGATTIRTQPGEFSWKLRDAIRTPSFWILLVATYLYFPVMPSVNLHQVPHMSDRGLSTAVAFAALSVYSITSGIGAVVWGFIAEKVKVRYCISLTLALSAIGVLFLMIVSTPLMAFAYSIYFGISSGAIFALIGVAWASYFGRESLATIRGATMPGQALMGAVGPFFAGWVHDVTGSYQTSFLIFAGIFLISALLILVAKPPQAKTVRK